MNINVSQRGNTTSFIAHATRKTPINNSFPPHRAATACQATSRQLNLSLRTRNDHDAVFRRPWVSIARVELRPRRRATSTDLLGYFVGTPTSTHPHCYSLPLNSVPSLAWKKHSKKTLKSSMCQKSLTEGPHCTSQLHAPRPAA